MPKQRQAAFIDSLFPVETGLPNLLNQSTPSFSVWSQGMEAFQAEDYTLALQLFNALEDIKTNNDTLLYYSGIAAYKCQDYSLSTMRFKSLLQNPESPYATDASFMLVLSYIQQKDKENARNQLQSIIQNTQHPYYIEAQQLLPYVD